MIRLSKIKYSLLSVLSLVFIFQACVKDDLSECEGEIRVFFKYKASVPTYNIEYKEGINPADVTQINLFVFNDRGELIDLKEDKSPQMSTDYYISDFQLRAGNYTFIAWGNLKEVFSTSPHDFVIGETSIKEIEVYLNAIKNRSVSDSITPLFFATHNDSETLPISDMSMKRQDIYLDMIQDTYRINIEVAGLDEATLEYPYQFTISDDNGRYNFDNSFAYCEKFNYTAPCIRDDEKDEIHSALTVLRLAEDRSPTLYISRDGADNPLIEDNLVELLKEANAAGADIDFNKHYTFYIRYELDIENPGTIIIYINDWRIVKKDGAILY